MALLTKLDNHHQNSPLLAYLLISQDKLSDEVEGLKRDVRWIKWLIKIILAILLALLGIQIPLS